MHRYEMPHLFSYSATLAPPEVIGPVPEGLRVNFYISGGELRGPLACGKLRPVGADWVLLSRDGVGHMNVRATAELQDGALVYLQYTGILDLGANGYEDFIAGRLPPRAALRTSIRMSTAHPEHAQLNRLLCIGVGEADFGSLSVDYDVYALR